MKLDLIKKIALMGALTAMLQSCYMEIKEDKKDEMEKGWSHSDLDLIPSDQRAGLTTCQQYKINGSYVLNCYESPSRRFLTNCSNVNGCQTVSISVNYLLQENLGVNKTVVVEAFSADGPQNYPAAVTKIFNFDASRSGTSAMESMFLGAGNYYFRAYLSDDDFATPFEYKGLEHVQNRMKDQPYGTYGASGVSSVQVNATRMQKPQNPVIINLNRLYRKVGEERASNANLRVKISSDIETPSNKDVVIKLYNSNDFRVNPEFTFKFSSNLLKIEGQKGHAEYIAPNLRAGDYFVQVFVDENGNGYADTGELQDTYKKLGELAKISIVENRTDLIDLKLVR